MILVWSCSERQWEPEKLVFMLIQSVIGWTFCSSFSSEHLPFLRTWWGIRKGRIGKKFFLHIWQLCFFYISCSIFFYMSGCYICYMSCSNFLLHVWQLWEIQRRVLGHSRQAGGRSMGRNDSLPWVFNLVILFHQHFSFTRWSGAFGPVSPSTRPAHRWSEAFGQNMVGGLQ